MDKVKAIELITSLTPAELRELNSMVVSAIRARRSIEVHRFMRGDRVKFEARGHIALGNVTKVNQKTVSVKVDSPIHVAGNWRVTPEALTKIA